MQSETLYRSTLFLGSDSREQNRTLHQPSPPISPLRREPSPAPEVEEDEGAHSEGPTRSPIRERQGQQHTEEIPMQDEEVDFEEDGVNCVPFGLYSGTPTVPHPHHAVEEELASLEDAKDATWCFMCTMRPSDVEMLEWQELKNHIETLGSRELIYILKDVQRSYNLHFKHLCNDKVWTLRSIEEHVFHHGGASEQAHAREQKRQFAMLRHYVAEHSCLKYDLSTKKIIPNTDGIAQVIKLAKLEQNLLQNQR